MIRPPPADWSDQEGDSKAGGTRVVLPAPGGAESTRLGRAARASRISGSTVSIGRLSIINKLLTGGRARQAAWTAALRRPVAR